MKKIVKRKIEKHYCDKCGKSIFDYIPKNSGFTLFGMYVPEFAVKRHGEHRIVTSRRNRGEYCIDCYNELMKGR